MKNNIKEAANKSIYDTTNPFDPAADIFRLMNDVEYASRLTCFLKFHRKLPVYTKFIRWIVESE